ncbi:hypothetical protein [Thalassoporum mexicanum]|uniref:hypothetical protein n=1 Tax=Thalassoporum mexicanum TaxID=3457544 RepID=UPI0005A2F16C|nr:hypothetical protein [Pseudanabaena sp. PCC 7367]
MDQNPELRQTKTCFVYIDSLCQFHLSAQVVYLAAGIKISWFQISNLYMVGLQELQAIHKNCNLVRMSIFQAIQKPLYMAKASLLKSADENS